MIVKYGLKKDCRWGRGELLTEQREGDSCDVHVLVCRCQGLAGGCARHTVLYEIRLLCQ